MRPFGLMIAFALCACQKTTDSDQARGIESLAPDELVSENYDAQEGENATQNVTQAEAPPPLKSAASYCEVGEQQWVQGCAAACTASWSGSDCPKSCTASPPPGYILIDHRVEISSENNGGHSVSVLPADGNYSYVSLVSTAYNSAIDLAAKANNKSAEAHLKDEMTNAINVAESYQTDHQMVRLEVSASKHGSWLDQKRGWSNASVEMLVQCAVPANLQDKIYERYGLK